ncbi:type III polyketide synthase [Nocardia sp. alder85J]|uniref:type III polyketide synthase n=1 Tax=Nocardia sp. alder85J TaxID=2862949 RepID=UPI002102E7B2|nr:type III polyketide synthase [Nocardia sp. alder85J]MCX4095358.1 type III polyketide synthase [Nocardia sp. alder85J]
MTDFGVAVPNAMIDQHLPDEGGGLITLAAQSKNAGAMRRIAANSRVEHRHMAIDPYVEDITGWSTGTRMRRYAQEALPLAKVAVAEAFERSAVLPHQVGLFCLVSSTGYAAPAIDTLVARDIGIPADVQRVCVGHMGCFAAMPGLGVCSDFVRSRHRPALLVNVELSSLHQQPLPWDLEQIVVGSLFGDAATAVIVEPASGGRPGLDVVDFVAHTDTDYADYMTWKIGDRGFRMGLSAKVPEVIGIHLPRVLRKLLAPHHLDISDIHWWAVHPGGRAIIDAVERTLGLPAEEVAVSRSVLRDAGNCSSAGVVQVLHALQSRTPLPSGQWGVAMAFGPGLTLSTALVRGAGDVRTRAHQVPLG